MTSIRPVVSVLLPVYNGERHLKTAVESILRQTYKNFELLIINDGSTDKSLGILSNFHDPRIHIKNSDYNLGLVAALNRGLSHARGKYIARMDADDICLPDRLARQVNLLEARTDIGACGCWWRCIDDAGRILSEQRLPVGPDECRSWFFLFGEQPIGHPCAMYRTKLVRKLGGYESEFRHAEDFRLWSRLALIPVPIVNVPEFLLMYRHHAAQVSETQRDYQRDSHNRALADFLSECLGSSISCQDASLIRLRDFRPKEITSLDMFGRLLELKFDSIMYFYRNSDLPDSLKYGMNLEVIGTLGANLAATSLAPRPALGMLYRFARRLNSESFSASLFIAISTLRGMKRALFNFFQSRLRDRCIAKPVL